MDRPQRVRLFVGIALDDATRAGCAEVIDRLRDHGFEARFESPEKLHITLAFLGNVNPDAVTPIEEKLHVVARECAPLSLTLDKLGAFPHERAPRIIYIGARAQGVAFRQLAHGVRGAYRELGFEFKDDAVAHVTIGRVKEHDRRRVLPLLEIQPMIVLVSAITLFESRPVAGTSRYEIRDRATLHSFSAGG